jgi:hypothetical protein
MACLPEEVRTLLVDIDAEEVSLAQFRHAILLLATDELRQLGREIIRRDACNPLANLVRSELVTRYLQARAKH